MQCLIWLFSVVPELHGFLVFIIIIINNVPTNIRLSGLGLTGCSEIMCKSFDHVEDSRRKRWMHGDQNQLTLLPLKIQKHCKHHYWMKFFYAGQVKVLPVQHNKFQSDPPSFRKLYIRKILLCVFVRACARVCFTLGDTVRHYGVDRR